MNLIGVGMWNNIKYFQFADAGKEDWCLLLSIEHNIPINECKELTFISLMLLSIEMLSPCFKVTCSQYRECPTSDVVIAAMKQ